MASAAYLPFPISRIQFGRSPHFTPLRRIVSDGFQCPAHPPVVVTFPLTKRPIGEERSIRLHGSRKDPAKANGDKTLQTDTGTWSRIGRREWFTTRN